jgi:CheY-like chemotaxis protein
MLRSALELSGRDYTVVDVSSGEEALLELGRGPVDVLVTDLRLPGISGLELLRRARQFNPEARAIMLTGQPSEEVQGQAEALGVVAFLRKPLATNFFLEAVERAIQLAGTYGSPVEVLEEEKPGLFEQLEALRRKVQAQAALLFDLEGEVVVLSGEIGGLDLGALLPSIGAAFTAGLTTSTLMGSFLPTNLQYFDGDTHHVYLLNVGAFYGLLVVFPAPLASPKLGDIAAQGSAAANDLLSALSRLGMVDSKPLRRAHALPRAAPTPPAARPAPVQPSGEAVDPRTADQFWEKASDAGKPESVAGDVMTYEEARRRGLIRDEPPA